MFARKSLMLIFSHCFLHLSVAYLSDKWWNVSFNAISVKWMDLWCCNHFVVICSRIFFCDVDLFAVEIFFYLVVLLVLLFHQLPVSPHIECLRCCHLFTRPQLSTVIRDQLFRHHLCCIGHRIQCLSHCAFLRHWTKAINSSDKSWH